MRGEFLLSLQLNHCLKRGCHIPGIDISLILSLTEKMNRILASVEHFMQPHEYCAQCCISYGVTENGVLHFISGCETSANKCWPCTTNVLREALNNECVIPIVSPPAFGKSPLSYLYILLVQRESPCAPEKAILLASAVSSQDGAALQSHWHNEINIHESWTQSMTYTTSTAHSLLRVHLAVLYCLWPTSRWPGLSERQGIFFSMQAVRSVHPSNPQESESEYLVKDGGRKVFTVLKNLGLVNAWENIASSALNFLIWLEASQTSHKTHLKLWAHARRGTASLFVSFSLGKIWPMVFCAAYTEWQAPTLLWCSH